MQRILSVNTSVEPAEAVLVELTEDKIQVIEYHTEHIGQVFASNESVDQLLEQAEVNSEESENDEADSLKLAELISRISQDWTSSILIVPSNNYLSLTLKLPFNDPKSIDKVIDLEVQDVVPFEVSEFLLDHSIIDSANGNGLNDVHVGLVPKSYVKTIITKCKSSGFEPVAVTSPSSAIASFYYAAPNYFAENSAIVYFDETGCHSCVTFNGIVRSDRSYHKNWIAEDASNLNEYEAELKELRVALASLEKRYGQNVETIYVLGTKAPANKFQNILGRNVEILDTSDITLKAPDAGTSIAAAASVFVRDFNPPRLLSNFRSREFAFRPQLAQLFSGLRNLAPYFMATLILAVVLFLTRVVLNEYELSALHSNVIEKISEIAPDAAAEGKTTVSSLKGAVEDVERQLTSLGAPSRFDPLTVFSQLAKDIAKAPAVSVTSIRITGSRVSLSGTAPSYAETDELRRVFKRNSSMYCAVTRDNSSSAGSSRGFEFTIELCS